MTEQKVKTRSVVFTFDACPEWNLNIHVILGDAHSFVIDTGLGSHSVKPILPYLPRGKPIVVVNTHFHWDHVWGNGVFKGSAIIAQRLCRQRLEEQWENMLHEYRQYVSGDAPKCLPNIVFHDELYFPDDGIRIFHTPGHTADGISVWDLKDGVLNAGDNVGDDMEHIVPEIECGQSVFSETLSRYEETKADTVVSGHNAVSGGEIFEKMREALKG